MSSLDEKRGIVKLKPRAGQEHGSSVRRPSGNQVEGPEGGG